MAEVDAAIYDDYTEITCNGAQCTRIINTYPKYMLCGDHYELRQAPTAEIKDGQLQITQCSNKDVYDITATDKSGKAITDLKVVQATRGHNIQFNITSKEQLDKVQLTPVMTETAPETINKIDWSDAEKQGIDVKQLPDKLILDEIPFDGKESLIDPWVNVTLSDRLMTGWITATPGNDFYFYEDYMAVFKVNDMMGMVIINLSGYPLQNITSAVLNLYQYRDDDDGTVTFKNLTCNNFDTVNLPYTLWNTYCPVVGSTIATSAIMPVGWKTINITPYAKKTEVLYISLNTSDGKALYDKNQTYINHTPYLTVTYESFQTDPLNLADFSSILFVDKNNSACSNAYTRADALNPATPWCNLETALDKFNGDDIIYIKQGHYFGYFDTGFARTINGGLTIRGYPGDYPILSNIDESSFNGSDVNDWVNIPSANGTIYRKTTAGPHSGFWTSNSMVLFPNQTQMLNYKDLGTLKSSTTQPNGCYINASTDDALICKFRPGFNPNGMNFIIQGKEDRGTIFIDAAQMEGLSYVNIYNLNISYGYRCLDLDNVSNVHVENVTIGPAIRGVHIDSPGTNGQNYNYLFRNLTIRGGNHTGWLWNSFYNTSSQAYQTVGFYITPTLQNAYNITIRESRIINWFDGLRVGYQTGTGVDHLYIDNNTISSCFDDGIEVESYKANEYNISRNIWYDLFNFISLAPVNSTYGRSFVYDNILTQSKYQEANPGDFWIGQAFKIDGTSTSGIKNISIFNNLIHMSGSTRGISEADTSSLYKFEDNNITNNIFMMSAGVAIRGAGNITWQNLYDYNVYYSETGGNLAQYYANGADAVARNFSSMIASPYRPATWDVHSTGNRPTFSGSAASLIEYYCPIWNSSAVDIGGELGTPDIKGNPIYLPRDAGPCEYQPPYSLTTFIYNATPTIYKDGRYRVTTASTQLLNFTLAPISGWAAYTSDQARPFFANLSTAYINQTQSSYFLTLSEPAILTTQVWPTATGARVFLNGTYTNQSINLNSTGWGSFYASHLDGNYTFKGYDRAVFDGSRNLTTFYIGSINQSSSQSFQLAQVNQTAYHLRNYENYTASMQLNFTFTGYNYTCTDLSRLIYVSDTGTYTRTYYAGDPDLVCVNATNRIIVNISGIEPAVGSNTITLLFTPLGIPVISNNQVFETDKTEFGLYVNPAVFNISYVEFYHADAVYQTPAVYANNFDWYNTTVYAPIIGEDPSRIIYFYWKVYFLNGSFQQTATFNYTVVPLWFDNCSRSPNATLQYFLFDENAVDSPLTAETFELSANYYYADRGLMKNFSVNLTGADNYTMCLYPGNESFYVDTYVKYTTAGGFTHRHYLSNHSINSTQQNISIYNTITTVDYSTLVLTVRDKSTYNYFDDGIVAMQRYYVADNTWRTVQMGYTGAYGNLPFNIIEKTTDYRFVMYDTHNHLLETSGTLQFTCTDARCDLTYLILPYSSLATLNITTWHVYDNTTGIVRTYWRGNTLNKTINIRVTLHSGAQTRTICDENSTASFGQSVCDISGKEGLYQVNVIVYGSVIAQYSAFIERVRAAISDFISESEGSFWSFGLVLVVAALGFFSPAAAVFGAAFAVIMLGYLGVLSGFTFMATIGVIVIAVVVGLKLRN